MDLAAVIRRAAFKHPERPALRLEGTTQTYGQLHERSCRLDRALAELGVEVGARVATLTDNGPSSLEQMVGLGYGGLVRAALYTHNDPVTNAYLLENVKASVLLVQRRHLETIAPQLPGVEGLRHVIVFDGDAPEGTLDYEELLAAAEPEDRCVTVPLDAPCVIRFSAGTTGKPKGIMHSVQGWAAVGTEMALMLPPLTADDRYLAAGPLSHATCMPLSPVLHAGGTVVLLRAFEPATFLRTIQDERCTLSFGVPTMIQLAATHPDASTTDVSSMRALVYGGAPMTQATFRQARAVFGDVLYQLYGQSEGAPLTTLSPADHLAGDGRWARSAGRETPNTVITIVDDQGDRLPPGQVGEVAARTPTAMAAIWGDPAADAARRLPDGSVRTRDMGYLDEHGVLFLTDRAEDMIISGGHNIWPAELENALADHPAVREVAVVGVPHDTWGETPMAAVVLEEGATATADELIAWTRDRVGGVKKVTSVAFVDELPKSAVGKILRRSIRDAYAVQSAPA